MPRTYSRNCDECGDPYEGYGAKFCGPECSQDSQRKSADDPLPGVPDEDVSVKLEEEYGHVAVMASTSIKTPKELLDRSGVDLSVWEPIPDSASVRKWDVPMKVDDEPRVIPCFYVSVRLRKKWEKTDLPRPLVINMPSLPKKKPSSGGAHTTLHYSDIHFPHHDPRTLSILYQVLDDVQPSLVVDHGDTLDCESISDYPKDPHNRVSLKDEIRMGADHFAQVTSITPHASHMWYEGNHEERMRRLIWKLAENRQVGEVITLPEIKEALEWGSLLGLDSLGWETTPYPKHTVLYDKLILCHGESARKHSGQSEKTEYEKYGKGGLSGHSHRIGFFGRTDYNGVHGWWGLGCMCKIRDDYTSFPNWQQGFGVVTWNDDKTEYHVERVRIFDGVAYFRGRRYEG